MNSEKAQFVLGQKIVKDTQLIKSNSEQSTESQFQPALVFRYSPKNIKQDVIILT